MEGRNARAWATISHSWGADLSGSSIQRRCPVWYASHGNSRLAWYFPGGDPVVVQPGSATRVRWLDLLGARWPDEPRPLTGLEATLEPPVSPHALVLMTSGWATGVAATVCNVRSGVPDLRVFSRVVAIDGYES